MNLHISKDVIGDICMRLAERVAHDGKINASRNFMENPELKRLLQRFWGTAVAQWLRCCVTNRKVAGSIPDGVTGIFH
jgi:hypothetical protein